MTTDDIRQQLLSSQKFKHEAEKNDNKKDTKKKIHKKRYTKRYGRQKLLRHTAESWSSGKKKKEKLQLLSDEDEKLLLERVKQLTQTKEDVKNVRQNMMPDVMNSINNVGADRRARRKEQKAQIEERRRNKTLLLL